MKVVWTRSMVERRMVEAQRVVERIIRHGGAQRAKDVPPHIHTDEDRMEWQRTKHERLKLEGFYDVKTGLLIKPVPMEWSRPGSAEARAISRAEEAIRWPFLYVADDRQRIALACFLIHRVTKTHGFPASVNARFRKQFLDPAGIRSCYALKDKALFAIIDGLMAASIPWKEMEAA